MVSEGRLVNKAYNFASEALPIIETERLYLTLLLPEQYHLLATYYQDNRTHLSPWEPVRNRDYFTDNNIQARLKHQLRAYFQDQALHWVAFKRQDVCSKNHLNQGLLSLHPDAKVIGVCNFTNIIQGPFKACHLGYSLAENQQGKGYMQEMLKGGIQYAFSELGLHRIMANYMPVNQKSASLLKALGFETEGLARDYLEIDGKWEDHVLTSKINDNVE
ncbi:GNAT family N-acetyltransferase [uncultured Shewanella sp.]|uniref:GNAT family N-acetyltransferase n=1 Tax=uncultured Shewanella sp. TaxID=173975 RepID=UPI00260E651D|nr:GNAT family N-acetyltransferase [uncultured Shewanella sp.]